MKILEREMTYNILGEKCTYTEKYTMDENTFQTNKIYNKKKG